MKRDRTARICSKGHTYYKSSSCPVCPICEKEEQLLQEFPSMVAAPARRALKQAGITDLITLSTYSETEVLALHGMGPNAISKLMKALEEAGLSFKCNEESC